MSDIELVIKIPEELFSEIDAENYQSTISWYDTTLYCAIANGTLLPKGHGRLIDSNELDNDLEERQKSYEHTFGIRQPINEAIKDGIIIARTHINYAETIIEADKEDKDKDISDKKEIGYAVSPEVEGIDENRLAKALSEMHKEIKIDGITVATLPQKVYDDFTESLGQTPEEYIKTAVKTEDGLKGFMEEAGKYGISAEVITGMLEGKLAEAIDKTIQYEPPVPDPKMTKAIAKEVTGKDRSELKRSKEGEEH